MAVSDDIADILLPGPFKRDDVLGYAEANLLRDGIGTTANALQFEMDSQGRASSRKWVRANAIYYLNGANYDLGNQSLEAVFPATVPWVTPGVIDITFDVLSAYVPIADSSYEVFFQPLIDGSSAVGYGWAVAGDGTYKTVDTLRIFVSTIGSAPTGVNPYGFCIALVYGT